MNKYRQILAFKNNLDLNATITRSILRKKVKSVTFKFWNWRHLHDPWPKWERNARTIHIAHFTYMLASKALALHYLWLTHCILSHTGDGRHIRRWMRHGERLGHARIRRRAHLKHSLSRSMTLIIWSIILRGKGTMMRFNRNLTTFLGIRVIFSN